MTLTVLETEKTDKELAEYYKKLAVEVHKPVIDLLNEAAVKGFELSVGIGPTPLGFQIVQLKVAKIY